MSPAHARVRVWRCIYRDLQERLLGSSAAVVITSAQLAFLHSFHFPPLLLNACVSSATMLSVGCNVLCHPWFKVVTSTCIARPTASQVQPGFVWRQTSGVPPFFVAFLLTPLASNASELLSSLKFAASKRRRSASLTFAQVPPHPCCSLKVSSHPITVSHVIPRKITPSPSPLSSLTFAQVASRLAALSSGIKLVGRLLTSVPSICSRVQAAIYWQWALH